jgi:hypothetical protein
MTKATSEFGARYLPSGTWIPFVINAVTLGGGVARAAPTLAQESEMRHFGAHSLSQFGASVAGVGDLDGDGRDDFAVASPGQIVQGVRRGAVQVFSGRRTANNTLDLLHTFEGPAPTTSPFIASHFARSIDSGSDIDGDGAFDVVVGSHGTGQVFLYSGATGAELMTGSATLHATPSSGHGAVVSFMNANGDAFQDLLVTSDTDTIQQPGRWEVIDGAWMRSAGAVGSRTLHTGAGLAAHLTFGSVAAAFGDIDGDGADEFAISGYLGDASFHGGYVEVRSGATGALLIQLGAPAPIGPGSFGFALASAGDFDGDGRGDLLVGIPTYDAVPGTPDDRGAIEIISGSYMAGLPGAVRTLGLYTGLAPGEQLGGSVLGVDLNADNRLDVVAGFRTSALGVGVRAISGRTGAVMWEKLLSNGGFARLGLASLDGGQRLILGNSTSDFAGVDFGEIDLIRSHDARGVPATLGNLCPCGVDSPLTGCPHVVGLSASAPFGALLAIETGSASVAGGGVGVVVTGGLPLSPVLLWGGSPGASMPYFNGLLGIAAAPLPRLRLGLAGFDLDGSAVFGPIDLGTLPPAIVGLQLAFQAAYRDSGCGAHGPLNTTNSYVVTVRH